MSKLETIFSTIGSTLGIASSAVAGYFGTLSADTFSEQVSSMGLEGWGEASSSLANELGDAADGNFFALTTVFGLLSLFSGSSSAEPDAVIEVFTQNNKPYNIAEKRAKKAYDAYDKNHVKTLDDGASLITNDPELAKMLDDIISNSSSKEELVNNLEALKNILISSNNMTEKSDENKKSKEVKKIKIRNK